MYFCGWQWQDETRHDNETGSSVDGWSKQFNFFNQANNEELWIYNILLFFSLWNYFILFYRII